MKKSMLLAMILIACSISANAQFLRLGIKAGANFSSFSGDTGDIDYSSSTSFHGGLASEIRLLPILAIGPELLYSSQGADNFKLEYIALPVMVKLYLIPKKFSLDLGPQFSFLVNDNIDNDIDLIEDYENEEFDFAIAGGATFYFGENFFTHARYTFGLTETKITENAEVRNSVFQLSLGYMFL